MFDTLEPGAVVVIGGSGGLGAEITTRFAGLGAPVVFTYRSDRERAERLQAVLTASGAQVQAQAIDLDDVDALVALFTEAQAGFGAIRAVVFASGPSVQLTPLAEMPLTQWQRCLNADATGFFNLLQAAIPHLRRSRGSLVALSTAATQRYAPLDILSAGPKASVEQLVRAVAREEGRNGIRANGVRVGLIDAGLGQSMLQQEHGKRMAETIVRATPLRRMGTAADVANAVLFFASPMASFVTGEFLSVDGGGGV